MTRRMKIFCLPILAVYIVLMVSCGSAGAFDNDGDNTGSTGNVQHEETDGALRQEEAADISEDAKELVGPEQSEAAGNSDDVGGAAELNAKITATDSNSPITASDSNGSITAMDSNGPSTPTDSNGQTGTTETVTPTQFLCYLLGNASEYSITYEMDADGEKRAVTHFFKDGKTALYYNATDINEVSIHVREIEKDGRVFYVVEEKKKVVSYKAPASDILLHELQRICLNGEYEMRQENGRTIFEYRTPHQQDESITSAYRFLMEGDVLRELDILYDLSDTKNRSHYCFGEFRSDSVEDEVFQIPKKYEITEYDVSLFGDEIPPWFE